MRFSIAALIIAALTACDAHSQPDNTLHNAPPFTTAMSVVTTNNSRPTVCTVLFSGVGVYKDPARAPKGGFIAGDWPESAVWPPHSQLIHAYTDVEPHNVILTPANPSASVLITSRHPYVIPVASCSTTRAIRVYSECFVSGRLCAPPFRVIFSRSDSGSKKRTFPLERLERNNA